jgi:hypothetical protein
MRMHLTEEQASEYAGKVMEYVMFAPGNPPVDLGRMFPEFEWTLGEARWVLEMARKRINVYTMERYGRELFPREAV